LAFLVLHGLHAVTTFVQSLAPPRDEPHEANYGRTRDRQPLGTDNAIGICLDDLRLSIDHQPQGAA
jgi:hypothetical protein